MKLPRLSALAVLTLASAFVFAQAPRRKPTRRARNQAAPAAKQAATNIPAVREIDLANFKTLLPQANATSSKPLLVNFWATWCVPCREEFPDLVRIDADYRRRGLDFIAISLDDVAEKDRNVPAFLKQMRAQMPVYLLNAPDPDEVAKAVDPTWNLTLPTTFLYDKRGQIAYKHTGRINASELRAAIKQVMDDKH